MEKDPVNKKVEAALNSLDQIKRAEPRPFLFGRIDARIKDERSLWAGVSGFVARPTVAIGAILLILLVNAMAIFSTERSNHANANKTPELATADEYSRVNSDFYEIENIKP